MSIEAKDAGQSRTTVHDALVARILSENPTAKAHGFKQMLRTLPGATYMHSLAGTDWMRQLGVIPDAFMVDTERCVVTIFEAVVSNDISTKKFDRISDLAWALDEDFYTLRLIRVDQFGSVTIYDPLTAYIVQCSRGNKRWQDLTLEATHADPIVAQVASVMQFATLPTPTHTESRPA